MHKLLVYVSNTSSLFPDEYKICNGRKKWVNKKKIGETAVDSADQIGLSWLKNVCKLICMHVSVFVMIETAIGNHMKSDGFMRMEEIKKLLPSQWYSIRIVIVTDHYCNVTICKYISFSIMWYNIMYSYECVMVLVFGICALVYLRFVCLFPFCISVLWCLCDRFHVTWFSDLDGCPNWW